MFPLGSNLPPHGKACDKPGPGRASWRTAARSFLFVFVCLFFVGGTSTAARPRGILFADVRHPPTKTETQIHGHFPQFLRVDIFKPVRGRFFKKIRKLHGRARISSRFIRNRACNLFIISEEGIRVSTCVYREA